MTNKEIVAAAKAELTQTTITYAKWKQQGFTSGHWKNAWDLLDTIVDVTIPAPTPTLLHPYAVNSVWNRPILTGEYTVSPDNAVQMAWVVANGAGIFGPTTNSVPSIYVADASTPRVSVQINYPSCGAKIISNVPIAPTWKPGNGTSDAEPGMVIREADNGNEWSGFKITGPGTTPAYRCSPNQSWQAGRLEVALGGWYGSGTSGNMTRGSGTLNGTGVITPEETKLSAGADFGHAIACAFTHTRSSGHVWPALYSDGTNSDSGSVPMGACFWLPPGYDIEASGLREWQKKILRTARKYGIIVVDTGAALLNEGLASVRARGQRFAWEDDGGWLNLPMSAVSNFQVIYRNQVQ